VTNKYGRENVSQIITFGTMAARAAIRDVGRVLEVPLPEVDRIAKMIPPVGPDSTIDGALEKIPQLRELRDKNAKIAHLLAVARNLEGQVRHPSIHAAGIVITPRPLVEFMPLYQSVKGEITSQFAMGTSRPSACSRWTFSACEPDGHPRYHRTRQDEPGGESGPQDHAA